MANFKKDGDKLLDRNGHRLATLDGKYIRDAHGSRIGMIDGKSIRDSHGNRIAEFDGRVIRDAHGSRIAESRDIEKAIDNAPGSSISSVAFWVFFVR